MNIHSVQVRTDDVARLHDLLLNDPALSPFDTFASDPLNGWVSVYPKLIIRGPKVARSLSRHLGTHAFAFRIYGDDTLLYEYYRTGERRDAYTSAPDSVRGLTEMDGDLEEIVRMWEEGELSADKYRTLMEEYVGGFDAKAESVRTRAIEATRGRPVPEGVRAARQVVLDSFRGRNAETVMKGVLESFTEREQAEAALEALVHSAPAEGGDARAFQELFQTEDAVAEVGTLLSRREGGGVAILRKLAGALGISGTEASYQQIQSGRLPIENYTAFSPEEE